MQQQQQQRLDQFIRIARAVTSNSPGSKAFLSQSGNSSSSSNARVRYIDPPPPPPQAPSKSNGSATAALEEENDTVSDQWTHLLHNIPFLPLEAASGGKRGISDAQRIAIVKKVFSEIAEVWNAFGDDGESRIVYGLAQQLLFPRSISALPSRGGGGEGNADLLMRRSSDITLTLAHFIVPAIERMLVRHDGDTFIARASFSGNAAAATGEYDNTYLLDYAYRYAAINQFAMSADVVSELGDDVTARERHDSIIESLYRTCVFQPLHDSRQTDTFTRSYIDEERVAYVKELYDNRNYVPILETLAAQILAFVQLLAQYDFSGSVGGGGGGVSLESSGSILAFITTRVNQHAASTIKNLHEDSGYTTNVYTVGRLLLDLQQHVARESTIDAYRAYATLARLTQQYIPALEQVTDDIRSATSDASGGAAAAATSGDDVFSSSVAAAAVEVGDRIEVVTKYLSGIGADYAALIRKANKESSSYRKEIAARDAKIATLTGDVDAAAKTRAKLENDLAAAQKSGSVAAASAEERGVLTIGENTKLKGQIDDLIKRNRLLGGRNEQLKGEIDVLEKRAVAAETAANGNESSSSALATENAHLRERVTRAESIAEAYALKQGEYIGLIKTRDAELKEAQAAINRIQEEARAQLERAKLEVAVAQQSLAERTRDLQSAIGDLGTKDVTILDQLKQLSEARQQRTDMAADIESRNKTLEAQQRVIDETRRHVEQLTQNADNNTALQEARQRIEQLEQQVRLQAQQIATYLTQLQQQRAAAPVPVASEPPQQQSLTPRRPEPTLVGESKEAETARQQYMDRLIKLSSRYDVLAAFITNTFRILTSHLAQRTLSDATSYREDVTQFIVKQQQKEKLTKLDPRGIIAKDALPHLYAIICNMVRA